MNNFTEQEKNVMVLAAAEQARVSRTMQWDWHTVKNAGSSTSDQTFESNRVKNNELVIITNIVAGTDNVNTSVVYMAVYDGVTEKPIHREAQGTDSVYVGWQGQVILYEGQSLKVHITNTTGATDKLEVYATGYKIAAGEP